MIKAKDVKPNKYQSVDIVYDGEVDDSLAIARLKMENGKAFYGIRWNGGENSLGYPSQGKYPLWFELPYEIKLEQLMPIISTLLKTEFES